MANRNRIEDAGVKRQFTFNKDGTTYKVFETSPKRTQDLLRFELWKPSASKPYVVSFQSTDGSRAACSCPAGLYHRAHGECKHVKMCRAEFLTASSSRPRQAARAPKALPAPQMSLPGLDEVKALEEKLDELRGAYASKKAELDAIEREGKLVREKLTTLKARRAA